MFEFFTALFGGAYYAGKYAIEKNKTDNYIARQAQYQNTRMCLERQLCADYKTTQSVEKYLRNAEHYDEICENFSEEFRFVLGDDWKEKLLIPEHPALSSTRVYRNENYSIHNCTKHMYWVYRLILASKGKVESFNISHGYQIGGIQDKDMCIKFAKCIESRLRENGAKISLVMELDMISGIQRTPKDVCGANIKISSLCVYPFCRLW